MADDESPEGWQVPQRRAFALAATVPLVLAAAVFGAARWYDAHWRPLHFRPVTTFPAPGVETFIHDGRGDPRRPPPRRVADPAVAAAKHAVATDGLAGWATTR